MHVYKTSVSYQWSYFSIGLTVNVALSKDAVWNWQIGTDSYCVSSSFDEEEAYFMVIKKKIITCVSVSRSELENSALSAIDRYCLSLNFFSSASSCWVVKGVLGFLLGLCFLRLHLSLGGSPFASAKAQTNHFSTFHTARTKD